MNAISNAAEETQIFLTREEAANLAIDLESITQIHEDGVGAHLYSAAPVVRPVYPLWGQISEYLKTSSAPDEIFSVDRETFNGLVRFLRMAPHIPSKNLLGRLSKHSWYDVLA